MSAILDLTEVKARFAEVVDRASQGEEIIVTRMGQPVVRISRVEPVSAARRLGLLAGRIHLAPDFDDWPADIAHDLGIAE